MAPCPPLETVGLADLFLGRPRSRRYPKFNIRRDIPDKFLLRFMREGEGPGDAALYRVEGTDEEGFTVTEIWRTTAFKGSFSAPVFYGGHLYGYNVSFLTCVDAATGKEVWKSRPLGGRTLGLADDHLLILAPRGSW